MKLFLASIMAFAPSLVTFSAAVSFIEEKDYAIDIDKIDSTKESDSLFSPRFRENANSARTPRGITKGTRGSPRDKIDQALLPRQNSGSHSDQLVRARDTRKLIKRYNKYRDIFADYFDAKASDSVDLLALGKEKFAAKKSLSFRARLMYLRESENLKPEFSLLRRLWRHRINESLGELFANPKAFSEIVSQFSVLIDNPDNQEANYLYDKFLLTYIHPLVEEATIEQLALFRHLYDFIYANKPKYYCRARRASLNSLFLYILQPEIHNFRLYHTNFSNQELSILEAKALTSLKLEALPPNDTEESETLVYEVIRLMRADAFARLHATNTNFETKLIKTLQKTFEFVVDEKKPSKMQPLDANSAREEIIESMTAHILGR